ncbi:MAG: BrnT family toxin [Alphaproteobacteria bacterium]|nr:BrnT family toxin [Alphaproteobacteria bacterium]
MYIHYHSGVALRFEWDESKRKLNIAKHRLDFADVVKLFSGPTLNMRSMFETEERWLAVGLVRGLEITVIYTIRGDYYRIISARRAGRNERKEYHASVAERGNEN